MKFNFGSKLYFFYFLVLCFREDKESGRIIMIKKKRILVETDFDNKPML
jgi:hypothetical protein